jgi:hypothetical protein
METIPKNLEECYVELKKIEDLDSWLKKSEETASAEAHHGIGRYIRNEWMLWKGEGELFNWFKSNEINHPDDMSGIILASFYRYMKGQDIKLDELIEEHAEYYLDDKEKLMRRRKKKLDKIDINDRQS